MTISQSLRGNTYPGRGIITGTVGNRTVTVYFIMGRSENSRNRVFEETADGIRTRAYDPKKLTDPSLVIYNPVRRLGDITVVTNGDQTDTIRDFLESGRSFYDAVRSRTFEPDPPNWTPRISGLIRPDGSYCLAIVKNIGGARETPLHCFYEYTPVSGRGHFIRTYMHDGDPLPSFTGEPAELCIEGSVETLANSVWDALDKENRVALYALDVSSGEYIIINKNKGDADERA